MADLRRLPGPVSERWDWQLRALCRTMDNALFFAKDRERGSVRSQREEMAKAVCGRCPVLAQCRQHALAVREPFGVWGGMTELERERALRDRQPRHSAA